MNLGEYPKYAVITLCGLLLFFLGSSLPFLTDIAALVSLFAIVLLTVAMSYGNRTPLGGFFLGIYASTSFLLGFFVMTCVWELATVHPYVVGPVGKEYGLFLLMQVLSDYGLHMLSAVFAFGSIGLFFGLLGYVSGHISLHVSVTQPSVFRDYWSSIHLLGKSDRREYDSFDRKLSSWSFRKKEWWRRILERITEPQPDLVFIQHRKKRSSELGVGDLFDLSSGRMIGNDLANPSDLVSRYRPSVLKVGEISADPKGVRRLALESLLARFLKEFMLSRAIWLFYALLSVLLVYSVYVAWVSGIAAYPYTEGVEVPVVASTVLASGVTLFFVWRWRKVSKELFVRRPDERVLIFVVYIILALLYGFYFEAAASPPAIPEAWMGAWLVWSKWLVPLAILLGTGYVCIHRECEVVNTYFYDNQSAALNVSRAAPFKEVEEEPFWLKEERIESYWVLRFMYFWRYEIAKIPHSDWERVEIWIDAKSGTPRWVVSDYHYRELWYKVEGDLRTLYVRFFINFHTPIPIVNSTEAKSLSGVFGQKTGTLVRIGTSGKAGEVVERMRSFSTPQPSWTDLHPADWITTYGLPKVAAQFCSRLNWTYWRYPHGLEEPANYLRRRAAAAEDQPERRPKLAETTAGPVRYCTGCGAKMLSDFKFCPTCGRAQD